MDTYKIKVINDFIEVNVTPSVIKDSRKLIVINSAMGSNSIKYKEMSIFFSENGWNVISYNYRGIGNLIDRKILKNLNLKQWGTEDMNTVISWGLDKFKPQNLVIMGHSIGAQLIQYLNIKVKPNRVVLFSGQKGYWKYWDKSLKIPIYMFWKIVLPINTLINKEFSLMKIANCSPLPMRVALDWRIWALNKKFIDKDKTDISNKSESLSNVPLLSIHISDDRIYAPQKAVDALLEVYSHSKITKFTLHPFDLKSDSLKHSGIFEVDKTLNFWKNLLLWLENDNLEFSLKVM